MKKSKESEIIIQNNTNKKGVESDIKEIAREFAEDIKEYVCSGGDINDLDANKIYKDKTNEKEQG